jgi:hypothetical protein
MKYTKMAWKIFSAPPVYENLSPLHIHAKKLSIGGISIKVGLTAVQPHSCPGR